MPCSTFDQIRYHKLRKRKKPTKGQASGQAQMTAYSKWPSSSASMELHILRAFCVSYNQMNLDKSSHPRLDPISYGYYETENGILMPKKNENIFPPATELVPTCNCKKSKCTTKRCICKSSNTKCCMYCDCVINESCENL